MVLVCICMYVLLYDVGLVVLGGFDVGEWVVVLVLYVLGMLVLDWVFFSYGDLDYVGGLVVVWWFYLEVWLLVLLGVLLMLVVVCCCGDGWCWDVVDFWLLYLLVG